MMRNADWAKGPLTLHQQNKWPFEYRIRDADGVEVHHEDSCSSSTDWKSIEDMMSVKGIKDGTCGQTRDEWMQDILNQRKKLMFLAQTDRVIVDGE